MKIKRAIEVEVEGLGEKIKRARKASNRTATSLAAEAKISRGYWYEIEKEQIKESLPEETLRKIEKTLGVDFEIDVNFDKRFQIDPIAVKSLPESGGIYFAIDSNNVVQYIGSSVNLNQKWLSTKENEELEQIKNLKIAWIKISDRTLLPMIERALIHYFQPILNEALLPRQTKK